MEKKRQNVREVMRTRKANEDICEEEVMLGKWNKEQVKKKMWRIKEMWE